MKGPMPAMAVFPLVTAAQAYVRRSADTIAANVVLYSPAEAAGIVDTVFRQNRQNAVRRMVVGRNLMAEAGE